MKNSQAGATLNTLFVESVSKHANLPALHVKVDGQWRTLDYREVGERVGDFAAGLCALGVRHGDRVAILSENRPEWAIADLAILAAGSITVPIYPTLPPGQIAHILRDSGACAVVLSDEKQLAKLPIALESCADLKSIVIMDPAGASNAGESDGRARVAFTEVYARGKSDEARNTCAERRDAVRPADLASLVYTSGTTGDPKGAMLSHGNFVSVIHSVLDGLPLQVPGEQFLSFLPLCHVFERATHFVSITQGGHTYYAENIFKLSDNMAETRPTIIQTVPRIIEVIHERILDTVSKMPPIRQQGFHEAIKIGQEVWAAKNSGKAVGPVLAAKHLAADRFVLAPIREKLGGRLRFFVSGGAPLRREPAEFFNAIGIPVVEAYGLTETAAAGTTNPAHATKVGTVGKPFPGVSLKIAADGEILLSGPNIMNGYWNQPQASAEAVDSEGWLHTGDIGVVDDDGYLTITDRKKDIIVLANGKNVAPQPIEALLRASKLIADIVLLGDHSGTVSALVVPDFAALAAWANAQAIKFNEPAELAASPDAKREIRRSIDQLSGNLAEFEKVRKIALLDHAFSVDAGELTPTLKVRRKVIRERYGHLLD